MTQGGELFSDARRRVVQRRGHTRQLATARVMDAAQGCKCNVSSHKCGYEREGRKGRDRREGKDTVFFPESACKKAIFLKRSTRRVSIIVVTLPNLSKKKRTRTIKNNKSMKRTIIFALVAVVGLMGAASVAWGQESPRWLRKNAISPDGKQIAFSYKGDIYVVPVAGGRAQ